MDWIETIKKHLKEELEDAVGYAEIAAQAHGTDRQVLRDMAKEEYHHAKHLCRILREHGTAHDVGDAWTRAKAAVWDAPRIR